jgi:hypothetical protein
MVLFFLGIDGRIRKEKDSFAKRPELPEEDEVDGGRLKGGSPDDMLPKRRRVAADLIRRFADSQIDLHPKAWRG